MPATEFPLPISLAQFRKQFVGLGDPIAAMEAYTGLSEDEIYEQYVRAALYEVQSELRIPFFVSRYCTRELATQKGYLQGTDFDFFQRQGDYSVLDWWQGTGSTRVYWKPVAQVIDYRLTLQAGSQVADIPHEWLSIDEDNGVVQILPSGLGQGGKVVFQVFAIYPIYRAAQISGMVPGLVHLRYDAGLVNWDRTHETCFDPEAYPFDTERDQNLIRAYQLNIGFYAASAVMRQLANYLDQGGVSISFDGLSASVNPQILWQRADALEKSAMDWATRTGGRERGVEITVI